MPNENATEKGSTYTEPFSDLGGIDGYTKESGGRV